VARECGLVRRGCRVFIGDLAATGGAGLSGSGQPATPAAGAAGVVWTDTDVDEGAGLDPLRLLPSDGTSAATPYRLALTGRAFAHLLALHRGSATAAGAGAGGAQSAAALPPDYLHRILLNCSVFARMAPDNKAALVEELQATGLYVMMVGDGANDSMALRSAHVGISLSQAEASVAAPFTSLVPDISCVPKVMCEGRGALATSFTLFNFMSCYSVIQFANALLAVQVGSFMSNSQYLLQDLWIVFVLSLTCTWRDERRSGDASVDVRPVAILRCRASTVPTARSASGPCSRQYACRHAAHAKVALRSSVFALQFDPDWRLHRAHAGAAGAGVCGGARAAMVRDAGEP
jgi:magnesium-transporting ATPase (P-type)